mmetsp:Transcript_52982/g.113141  ORF Transcript_52982/g.113141 Transcript_52982/m.113141 type:complete len:83 (+) Transcript_52982:1254-1502(+)
MKNMPAARLFQLLGSSVIWQPPFVPFVGWHRPPVLLLLLPNEEFCQPVALSGGSAPGPIVSNETLVDTSLGNAMAFQTALSI